MSGDDDSGSVGPGSQSPTMASRPGGIGAGGAVELAEDRGAGGRSGDTDDSKRRRIERHLLAVTREVAGCRRRDLAERTLCERLVASTCYRSAWIGRRTVDSDDLAVRERAGDAVRTAVSGTPTVEATEDGSVAPWREALRTGVAQVADTGRVDPAAWPGGEGVDWHGTVAAVPLGGSDTALAVIGVHAGRTDGFGPVEREGLNGLGRVLTRIIEASRSRDLFHAESAVELAFTHADRDAVPVRLSGDHDCRVELDHHLAAGEHWLCYLSIDGANPEAVAGTASQTSGVERCRVLDAGSTDGRLMLTLADPALLQRTAAAGGTVASAVAEGGRCRVTAEFPATTDVRGTVARLEASFRGFEIRARRERTRPPDQPTATEGLLDRMTDRQREVLEASYRAGYFEWPRESTTEDIAPGLDITPSTLQAHLRKAERRLLTEIFE